MLHIFLPPVHLARLRQAWYTLGALALLGGAAGCADWPSRFERIDHDRPRVLDFVYRNLADTTLCEGAPGDTIIVSAYFAGDTVAAIDWEASFNVVFDLYFGDTAKDRRTLEQIPVPAHVVLNDSAFSPATQVVHFAFKIPDSIMYMSEGIDDRLFDTLGLDRRALIDLVETASGALQGAGDIDSQTLAALVQQLTAGAVDADEISYTALLQLLTARIRLFARINGVYRVRSDFSVRYNRRFAALPGVTLNRNPRVRFLGVYKVKNPPPVPMTVGTLRPSDTTYVLIARGQPDPAYVGSAQRVLFTDTVTIDTGYSYYLVADSGRYNGVDLRDTAETLRGTRAPEDIFFAWFYQHDPDEALGVNPNDFMITGGNSAVVPLLPPRDERITFARLWVQAWDSFAGEFARPLGSMLYESRITFRYTRAWRAGLDSRALSGAAGSL